MAKTYVCDACGTVIDNPYKARMKEFCIGCEYDLCGVFPKFTTIRKKVHLCDECYHALNKLAERKE